jgi:hypothetical protein
LFIIILLIPILILISYYQNYIHAKLLDGLFQDKLCYRANVPGHLNCS